MRFKLMQTYYIVASNDLLHFGKGHDDNPPGRGSGRYAWGSGKDYKIKENSRFGRISLNLIETVPNVRKYVSKDEIEDKWFNMFGKAFGYENIFIQSYRSTKDIKVAGSDTLLKTLDEYVSNNDNLNKSMKDVEVYKNKFGIDDSNFEKTFFESIGFMTIPQYSDSAQSEYLNKLKEKGYDAMEDMYGIRTGGNKSLIILDPDKTLQLKTSGRVKIN
jgi:hypothetical protein